MMPKLTTSLTRENQTQAEPSRQEPKNLAMRVGGSGRGKGVCHPMQHKTPWLSEANKQAQEGVECTRVVPYSSFLFRQERETSYQKRLYQAFFRSPLVAIGFVFRFS